MVRLRRLLKIHAGEESVATRMLLLMFLVWTAATIGSSGIESLLFSRYGPEALPYLFIVIGLITLPAMARLGALLQRPDRRRVLSLLPLTLGAALAAGRALMLTEATWVYPVLWLLMMVVWIMEATGAWAVASLINDTRQAKRLFPLYGAGQIVGGATGGLLTVPLARVLHAENLIFVWAAALVAATFLVRSLFRSEASRSPHEARMRRAPTTSLLRNVQQGLRLIKSSTLLVWLAVAMVLFALLYNSLSFVFAEAVTARFASTDSLAAFIGLFNALINGAALIVSLFIANRLFARFGIATMVLTLTVIYLVGFAALSARVGFVALVTFRLIQMVWVNGVWITGWQALFTIVPPERRGQVTSFMDGVAWEGGMMLAGLAIIVAEVFRGERAVFAIGVGGSALLMVAMWRARHAYGPAVADAVREGRPDVFGEAEEPFGGFKSDASAVSMLVQSAGDPDADVRRVAVAIAADLGTPEVLPAILAGAVDDDPEVKALALESLARHPDPSGSAPAAAALSHEDASVRAGAVDALVACSGDRDSVEEKLRERLKDDDAAVRARALVGLVRTRPDAADRRQLVEMLRSPDQSARGAAAVALGDLGERDLLEEALSDAHPEVRKSAVRAIAPAAADGSPRALISALWDPDAGVRNAAAGAIASLGSDAVPLLEEALNDPRTEPYALRALRNIGGAHAERISAYARAQVEAATHYGRLASMLGTHTDERIELLAYSLKSMMAQHAENALWAIASVDNVNRLGPAIESLTSPRASQRATALEAIEALGASEIVRPLLAVWEREPDRRRDIAAVLDELFSADDPLLRACAALASQSVPGSVYIDRLRALSTHDSDEVVRDTATLVLEGVEMETLDTLPVVKRLLFLRKAALFAELTPADLKSVAEAAQENFYSDGEIIAAQGEPGGEMHVVVTGEIEVDLGRDDSRMELARRGPGEVVGEMSLITEEPRMASLVAVGDVRTLSIDRPRFERILVERPKVSLAVMRELCARLTQSLDRAVASH